jgi:glycosyltransferase involved in cell wall biosynthesis
VRRLLVFTENYARGGGNRYMIDLLNGLHGDFDEVLMAANAGGVFAEDLARASSTVKLLRASFLTRPLVAHKIGAWPRILQKLLLAALVPAEPLLFLFNVLSLRALLARARPAMVVVCNGGYPASQACLAMLVAARMAGLHAAMSIVSTPSPRRRSVAAWDALLDRLSWRNSGRIIVNAEAISLALQTLRGMPPGRADVLHNGLEDTPPAAPARRVGRLQLGCVARLDRLKGVLDLLEAYSSLAGTFPQLDLVLAGEGDFSQQMRLRTRELGLQDRVHFLGHYTGDIATLLASFDIYAFPSLWEGFPYSILEAMRAGCPIVATRVGGIPEAIRDRSNGLLVGPGEPQALAAAIAELARDAELRQTLGENARLDFDRHFSLSRMHARTRGLLLPELAHEA